MSHATRRKVSADSPSGAGAQCGEWSSYPYSSLVRGIFGDHGNARVPHPSNQRGSLLFLPVSHIEARESDGGTIETVRCVTKPHTYDVSTFATRPQRIAAKDVFCAWQQQEISADL